MTIGALAHLPLGSFWRAVIQIRDNPFLVKKRLRRWRDFTVYHCSWSSGRCYIQQRFELHCGQATYITWDLPLQEERVLHNTSHTAEGAMPIIDTFFIFSRWSNFGLERYHNNCYGVAVRDPFLDVVSSYTKLPIICRYQSGQDLQNNYHGAAISWHHRVATVAPTFSFGGLPVTSSYGWLQKLSLSRRHPQLQYIFTDHYRSALLMHSITWKFRSSVYTY